VVQGDAKVQRPRLKHFLAQLPDFPLKGSDLATLPLDRQFDLWLSLQVEQNPQSQLHSPESAFLYGPGGETPEKRLLRRMSAEGIDGDLIRPKVQAPVYALHVAQEDEYIVRVESRDASGHHSLISSILYHLRICPFQDLVYWTFYPFNLGKEVPPLGILGNRKCGSSIVGESKTFMPYFNRPPDVADWEVGRYLGSAEPFCAQL
jgi:hypothetical protein